MDRPESDEEVMRRLGGGDRSALGELMARWQGRVAYFIHRMCGPAANTEDVCQDVWLRVYRYRERYDAARPFGPYLFAIAGNCCRTAASQGTYRRERERSLEDAPAPLPVSDVPQPVQTLISREETRALHGAISRLPDMQRAVVLLYLLCSADYDQIARTLKKKGGTVRSHMHHALRKLRGALNRASTCSESQVDYERPVP